MQHVSIPELRAIISARPGAQFISILARVDARLKKTDNPFGKVFKTSQVNGVIGFRYASAVNKQRAREFDPADGFEFETFEPLPRKWGQRVGAFVEHNGKTYLEMKVEKSTVVKYETEDGREVTAAEIAPWLPKVSSSADHQEVEQQVILRDYAMESIVEMKVGGEVYAVSAAEGVVI